MLKNFYFVLSESQDTLRIKNVISFKDSGLGDLIEKTVFTGSDGASVNCGKNIILVKQFQEDFPYICVIQCFSQIRKIT